MKVLYCDCFSGISGDMFLGALIDAGADVALLQAELAKLGIEDEYRLRVSKTVKKGIAATDVQVDLIPHVHHDEHKHHSEHTEHHHHHEEHGHVHHRNLQQIAKLIDQSTLAEHIKANCKYIFQRLAKAEAKVHGTTIDQVHFHEVGAVDAIVDICGAVIALDILGIEKVVASPIPTGSGFVECAHGTIPVPAPATVELLKGVPVYNPGIQGELVTPTGAAIITSIADNFDKIRGFSIHSIGYGAGNKDFGLPNVLRVFVGEEVIEPRKEEDTVFVLETTVDDCSPEVLGYLWDKLANCALDMFYTPVYMKKGRPAILITVLSTEQNLNRVKDIVFSETSTIGIRVSQTSRFILPREITAFNSSLGKVTIKVSGNTFKPEFEDLKLIAQTKNIPLKEVYAKVMSEYIK